MNCFTITFPFKQKKLAESNGPFTWPPEGSECIKVNKLDCFEPNTHFQFLTVKRCPTLCTFYAVPLVENTNARWSFDSLIFFTAKLLVQ